MARHLFFIASLCLLSLMLIGCGDEENELEDSPAGIVKEPTGAQKKGADLGAGGAGAVEDPQGGGAELFQAIDQVLGRLREGYQKEDLPLYRSAFWDEGFRYVSDMGTEADKFDDLIFDRLNDEEKSAGRIFARFQDIEMEFSHPPQLQNIDQERLEARVHYRIQGFANAGAALEGGFVGWYAEGDSRFTVERRKGEWRITEWVDEAFDEVEIRLANNLDPEPAPAGKLATTWGNIKAQ